MLFGKNQKFTTEIQHLAASSCFWRFLCDPERCEFPSQSTIARDWSGLNKITLVLEGSGSDHHSGPLEGFNTFTGFKIEEDNRQWDRRMSKAKVADLKDIIHTSTKVSKIHVAVGLWETLSSWESTGISYMNRSDVQSEWES